MPSPLALESNTSNHLRIYSLNRFARLLCIRLEKLNAVAASTPEHYHPFLKKTGSKTRWIDNPAETLKQIQSRINEVIFRRLQFPNYIIGGVSGRNPLEHPLLHIRTPIVITIDVKECFPGIGNSKIFKIWKDDLKCSPSVARLATKLTTVNRHLPLGAPTSNALANLALLPCVKAIQRLAHARRFRCVSQYIDDQAISGDALDNDFITEVVRIFSRYGFTVNRRKIEVMRRGKAQVVTKKNVNRQVSVPRTRRKQIEAALYELEKTDPSHPAFPKIFQSLKGKIHSFRPLHPEQASRFLERLDKIG